MLRLPRNWRNRLHGKTLTFKDAVPDWDGDDKAAPDIKVKLEWRGDTSDYGLAIMEPEGREFRVLVENKHGHLTCHLWATKESLHDGEPSHSIDLELEQELHDGK